MSDAHRIAPTPRQPRLDPFVARRLQRGVEHLHRGGPVALGEFIIALGDRIGGLPAALTLLNEFELRLVPRP